MTISRTRSGLVAAAALTLCLAGCGGGAGGRTAAATATAAARTVGTGHTGTAATATAGAAHASAGTTTPATTTATAAATTTATAAATASATAATGSATTATPITLRQIVMANATTGWGLAADGAIVRTDDGGASWRAAGPRAPTSGEAVASAFLDDRHAWVAFINAGKFASVYATADGGGTWSPPARVPVRFGDGGARLDFADPSHGWLEVMTAGMGALQAQLFRTTDGGRTWTQISATTAKTAGHIPFGADIRFLDARTGWLAGQPRAAGGPSQRVWFYVTHDGGVSWQHQSLALPAAAAPEPVDVRAPQLLAGRTAVVPVALQVQGRASTAVFATQDGGGTWRLAGTAPVSGAIQFLNGRDGWTAGWVGGKPAAGALYRTTDGGASWQRVTASPALTAVGQLDFVSARVGWALTQGPRPALLETTDGGRTWHTVPAVLRTG